MHTLSNILIPAAVVISSGGFVNLLVSLLVLALVIWLVYFILGMLPIPAPAKQIVSAILAIIFLLVLLSHLGFIA